MHPNTVYQNFGIVEVLTRVLFISGTVYFNFLHMRSTPGNEELLDIAH